MTSETIVQSFKVIVFVDHEIFGGISVPSLVLGRMQNRVVPRRVKSWHETLMVNIEYFMINQWQIQRFLINLPKICWIPSISSNIFPSSCNMPPPKISWSTYPMTLKFSRLLLTSDDDVMQKMTSSDHLILKIYTQMWKSENADQAFLGEVFSLNS